MQRLWVSPAIKGTSVLCPVPPSHPRVPMSWPQGPHCCLLSPETIIQVQTQHFFFSPRAHSPGAKLLPALPTTCGSVSSRCPQSSPRTPDPSVSRFPLSPTSLSPASPAAPPGLPSDVKSSWARLALTPASPHPAQLLPGHLIRAALAVLRGEPLRCSCFTLLPRPGVATGHAITRSALPRLEPSSVQQGLSREACGDRVEAQKTAGLCPQGRRCGSYPPGRA